MNSSLRVKKYLKFTSLGSSAMIVLVRCSKGRRMATPKLAAAPAPSWPARMMPSPAPVMTIQLASRMARAKASACL